ncbi:MAG: DUF1499 domain-containing protein [Gammaproteobacteria bacterium]|nr:DUF1499 domain-containing protein [Gammaproteobacteria bacterium]NNJ49579.1 DUF1499 domain-containing protein [Gammaproteobacteria bacterium]
MTIIKIIAFITAVIVAIVFYTLHRNQANLFEEPGFYQRVTTFMTTNVAETADDHPFAELRTPVFNVDAEKLYQRVLYVAAEAGWNVLAHDRENLSANFVERTPVFLFEDDIFVQVKFVGRDESSLYVRSSSRNGSADLAANSGHIQTLIQKIKE